MGSASKRSIDQMDGGRGSTAEKDQQPTVLHRIRNVWQFANLCQWIYLFGRAVKIDDNIDIEELEADCLNPRTPKLLEVGLALLKVLSSHRGLTLDLFDEYTRRQFVAKAPERNPFGTDDVPAKFGEFDVFTKIRVLQQMTQWIMMYPERIREKMEEQKDIDQASWRIEPYGWDGEDRTYFVLDDNRIYRLSEAPSPPPPKPKPKTKKKTKKTYRLGSRSSKRRRVSQLAQDESFLVEDDAAEDAADELDEPDADESLGGMKWECIAITLDQVRAFVQTLQRTRDENEKTLRSQLEEHLVPILEKQEESRRRKAQQRERELLNLAKMANAKRSSRIAHKLENQRVEEQAIEEERRRRDEEAAEKRAEQLRLKLERERDLRLMSREKRLKEREARRIRHEEELAQLSEDSRNTSASNRLSERRLQQEIERNKLALQELEDADDDWMFDCVCGVHGHVDDGTHSVACEKCNVWQHSKCIGINEDEAERPEFHFVCGSCKRRELESQRPRTIIKIKTKSTTASPSSSPAQPAGGSRITIPLARAPATETVSGDKQPAPDPRSSVSLAPQWPPRGPPETGRQAQGTTSQALPSVDGPVAEKSTKPDINGSHPLVASQAATTLAPPPPHAPRPIGKEQLSSRGQGQVSLASSGANGLKTNHSPAGLSNGFPTTSMAGSTPSKTPMLPHPAVTPNHGHASGEAGDVLPPPSISPMKTSPPAQPSQPEFQPNTGTALARTPASILPREAKLTPRAHEQVLTPPVKNVEQSRRPSDIGSS